MKRDIDTDILNRYLDEIKSTYVRDPSTLQSEEDAEGYRRSLKEGDTVAIRTTYGQSLKFTLSTVTSTKRGRVYTNEDPNALDVDGGHGRGSINSWFMKSGKNCNAPTGQASLVKPTDEVLDFISKGRPSWWYEDDDALLSMAMYRYYRDQPNRRFNE